MKNKNIIIIIIVLIVVAGGAFFAGMKYQQSKLTSAFGQFAGARNGQAGQARQGVGQGQANGLRPVMGQVLSSDGNSITVKMQDGSSKIVILTDSTSYSKTDSASKEDLKDGDNVAVFGTSNSDGSVTAQNVQLNPEFRGIQGGQNN
jgi:flagellar basal body-associated protein FliL